MNIVDAQRENRFRFSGGLYGQAVSGLIWLISAGFASWGDPKTAILFLVAGGFFIFPITELLVRTVGTRSKLSSGNHEKRNQRNDAHKDDTASPVLGMKSPYIKIEALVDIRTSQAQPGP
jgi:hypothetical protein